MAHIHRYTSADLDKVTSLDGVVAGLLKLVGTVSVKCSYCSNDANLDYFGPPGLFICDECFIKGAKPVSVPNPTSLHTLPGGATRSERKPAYHLVPMEGPRRTALRFQLGADVHGPTNWMRSTVVEHEARAFCDEAYNHMMEHAFKMANGLDANDDHLGAIGWAQSVLCYVESIYGKPWTSLRRGASEEDK